jgi:hypothetical protein
MSISPESIGNFLPSTIKFDIGDENSIIDIEDMYNEIANAVNEKDIGIYDIIERQNGQQYYTPNNPQEYRNILRKVIPIPALTIGSNAIAHGITNIADTWDFTRIYGVIKRASGSPIFIPIPDETVHIEVNSVNVLITNVPASYIGFIGNVVLEYIKF